jgi:AraC-like DNA-binding protein
MQWAPDPAHPGQKDLTLVHQVPGGSTQPFGVLLVRLDALKVSNLIKTMTPYNDGEAFLISESGDLIASTGDQNGPTPLAQALQKEIAARSERQGSFFYTWDRVTYTVSYGLFDRIGTNWMYVSAAPITSITAPVVSVSKMILAVSSAVLLLAVCLAWLASRRIYSPVRQLVQNMLGGKSEIVPANDDEFKLIEREWQYLSRESRELQAKLERQLPHVKESFLLQLVQGYLFAYSEDDLRERMKHYNWDVDDCTFVVAYIRLTGFTLLEGRFSQGDEGLVTFAAVNMIEEMSARRFAQSDVLNFHDLSAGLFLAVPGTEDLGRELRALAEELTQAINQLLKLRVTIVIGRPTRQIAHIPHLFEEAKQVIGYRMFERNNQVIEMERYDRAESPTDIRYPFALEREIVQALRTGREQETIDGLEAFLEALSGPGATEIDVRQGMLHLLGSLLHAMLGSGVNPNCLFKGANPYELLSQIREPEHMLSWFRDKLVAPFLRKLEERTDAQVKRIVEQAVVYLQNNYMKDISLDSCADHTGTNPYFLSKAFKQITGRNFIDTLTEIRLEKAKELLRESECKINVVAELVGYQHTYFNRIFKKLEGVTPGQYREMSRAGEP